jgi:NAD(P)-dependent dehydrogenase (short-subunit alcohol dehydrogenase family)
MSVWTTKDIPSQAGKLAIVTGANSGIGYETALELARAGAEVVVASRNASKGNDAVARIKAAAPGAKVTFEALDLASLASVAAFAARVKAAYGSLDLLINNAGLMALPKRQVTADGFEMQLGTNYLGHFALTGHLLPLLQKAPAPRTVQLSSIAHKSGQIDFADLQAVSAYKAWKVYSQSKLAMLMFGFELQRRSDANGWGIKSLAAHPGFSRTALVTNGPGDGTLFGRLTNLVAPLFAQSAAAGALPVLMAATLPDAKGGAYYGSIGLGDAKGPPGLAKIANQARDLGVAARLWDVSEQLTGVIFGQS